MLCVKVFIFAKTAFENVIVVVSRRRVALLLSEPPSPRNSVLRQVKECVICHLFCVIHGFVLDPRRQKDLFFSRSNMGITLPMYATSVASVQVELLVRARRFQKACTRDIHIQNQLMKTASLCILFATCRGKASRSSSVLSELGLV